MSGSPLTLGFYVLNRVRYDKSMKIILGSKSARRQDILRKMGYHFEVKSADIDEKLIRENNPETLTLRLANAKAEKLLEDIQEPVILITSDIVCVCDGKILEKPESKEEAEDFLKKYGQHPVETVCAVVVTNAANGKRLEGIDRATVYFNPIPQEVIDMLVNQKTTYDYAGGFNVADPLVSPYIDHIDGELDSVMGLPQKLTKQLLEQIEHES